MSRRGLVIRLLIFGPLFAYFGYGAVQKWRAERATPELSPEAAELKAATKTLQLQNGRTIDIVELTPEQAERLHGIKVEPREEPVAPDATPPTPPAAPLADPPNPPVDGPQP